MRDLYLLVVLTLAAILIPKGAQALPWNAQSTNIEVLRDDYNGQHVYLTYKEGSVTMMRAALPNNWKIKAASVSPSGFTLSVEGKPLLCYSSQSFGRVYGAVMSLEKDEDLKKAEIWERNRVECE